MKKKIKFIVICFIAMYMCGCGATVNQDNGVVYKLKTLPKTYERFKDMAVFNDVLYVYTSEGVELLQEETSSVQYALKGDMTGKLAVGEEFGVFDFVDQLIVYQLDQSSSKQISLEGRALISKIEVEEDKIWILYGSQDENKRIAYYDLNQAAWYEYALKDFNVVGLDLSEQGEIVVLHKSLDETNEEVLNISLLKQDSKEVIVSYRVKEKIVDLYSIHDADIKMDANGFYICVNHRIYRFEIKSKKLQSLLSEPDKTFSKIEVYNDKVLVNGRAETEEANQLYVMQEVEVNEQEQLVLLMPNELKRTNQYTFMEEAELLRPQYPDLACTVVGLSDYANYEDKIRTKLLAKDDDFDLFFIHTGSLGKMNDKLLEPLEIEAAIDEQLYPAARRVMTKGERQVGVVNTYGVGGFMVNNALKEIIDVEYTQSLNWDWQEFITLTRKWTKDTNGDGMIDIWFSDLDAESILRELIVTYDIQNEEIGLDENIYANDEFITLIEEVKCLQEEGLLINKEEKQSKQNQCFLINVDSLSFINPLTYERLGESVKYYALPVIDKMQPIFSTGGVIYCVNPYSPKKEVAKKLLLETINPEIAVPKTKSMLYKNIEWYDTYYTQYLEKKQQQGGREIDEREIGWRMAITDEVKAVLDYAYENAYVSQIAGYLPTNIEEMLGQYAEEKIESDIVVARLGEIRKSMK